MDITLPLTPLFKFKAAPFSSPGDEGLKLGETELFHKMFYRPVTEL